MDKFSDTKIDEKLSSSNNVFTTKESYLGNVASLSYHTETTSINETEIVSK
jgi:hypothetical protein